MMVFKYVSMLAWKLTDWGWSFTPNSRESYDRRRLIIRENADGRTRVMPEPRPAHHYPQWDAIDLVVICAKLIDGSEITLDNAPSLIASNYETQCMAFT